MNKIFTTGQVKELDRYTVENEPVTSFDLVERAASRFVHEFMRHYSRQMRVVVFAGQGNNGADALAIARLLAEESFTVETYLFNPAGQLSPECRQNRERLLENPSVSFTEVTSDFEPPELSAADVVIDGLFGTGLTRPLTGGFAAVVDYINQSGTRVVSVDIPSGLFGEDNCENDPAAIVKAEATITFCFPKLSFLLPENACYVGRWKVVDIGLHPGAVENTAATCFLAGEEDAAALVRPRASFSHKGTYGHALLIAGSRGKAGAAVLAARSCLRSGAGLLTVHTPQRGEPTLQVAVPEAMLSLDQHSNHFSIAPETAPYTAIGIGPGLGQNLETVHAFEQLLLHTAGKPMVIDADALNILSVNPEFYEKIPAGSILTPHPGEFDRLAGESFRTAYARLEKARAFAAEKNLLVVLKGHHTAVCFPSGEVCFNSSGNPGMATAGSGDVLTGILLGLLAQGYSAHEAALLGVYLHGAAGDIAAASSSEESLIAGDITENLGQAYRRLK